MNVHEALAFTDKMDAAGDGISDVDDDLDSLDIEVFSSTSKSDFHNHLLAF